MATLRTRAFAAVLAAFGLAGLGSAAFAEQQVAANGPHGGNGKQLEFRQARAGNGPFQLTAMGCGPLAADRMQLGLDSLAQRLKLTADQQKLFDTFRASALTAQTKFAETCKTERDEASLEPGAMPGMPGMDAPGAMQAPDAPDAAQVPPGPDAKTSADAGKTINPKDLQQGEGGPDGDHRGGPRFNLVEGLEMRLAIDEARIEALKTILPDLKAFYASLTPEQIKLLGHGMGGPLGFDQGFGPGRGDDAMRPAHRG